PRQADIEQRQVEVLSRQRRQRAPGVTGPIDRKPRHGETAHDRIGNQLVVLDHQDPHASLTTLARRTLLKGPGGIWGLRLYIRSDLINGMGWGLGGTRSSHNVYYG